MAITNTDDTDDDDDDDAIGNVLTYIVTSLTIGKLYERAEGRVSGLREEIGMKKYPTIFGSHLDGSAGNIRAHIGRGWKVSKRGRDDPLHASLIKEYEDDQQATGPRYVIHCPCN